MKCATEADVGDKAGIGVRTPAAIDPILTNELRIGTVERVRETRERKGSERE
jgi:hypothetical protein